MNELLNDNKVSTVQSYLREHLSSRYDEREAAQITDALFAHFFSWSRADLVMQRNERISESEILKLHFALKRLKKGEPLQYITQTAYFRGDAYFVSPAVLIPRPETEELVSLVLEKNTSAKASILDVGTGSGCIPLSLQKALPQAYIAAVDVSADALDVAKKNASLLQLSVDFSLCDILQSAPEKTDWDIIVSNPPYVLESDKAQMSEHVLAHEPHLALFVPDTDALRFYRRLFQLTASHLKSGGYLICEVHESQGAALVEMSHGTAQIVKDIAGKDRFFLYRKP